MTLANAKVIIDQDSKEHIYPWHYLFHPIKTGDTFTIHVFETKENFLHLTNPKAIHYNCIGWKKV